MPVSSLEIATTAAPYFFTSGSTLSRRSSSPVTEFTSGLPLYTASPASSAATIEESIDSGTSVIDCTSWIVLARIAGSSASGMPAFTSSMCAPAASCASVSDSTRLKLPAAISAARILRPVGLMRSPIMTNGRSKPMTTSRVAELITVSVMTLSCLNSFVGRAPGARARGRRARRSDR